MKPEVTDIDGDALIQGTIANAEGSSMFKDSSSENQRHMASWLHC
jgi:hypothetical protein